MKYIVENFYTEQIIKVFDTEEQRQDWIDNNVSMIGEGGYTKDGTRISIYETKK